MISVRATETESAEDGVGFLPLLAAAAPAVMGMMKKPGTTTVKKGNTIVGAPQEAPKSAIPWVMAGVGGVVLLSVGAWLVLRRRK
jgi:hypothetical protein